MAAAWPACGGGLDRSQTGHARHADTSVTPGGDPNQDRTFLMGQGLNPGTQTFVGTCLTPANTITNTGIRQGSFSFDHSLDSQTLLDSLGFSVKAKVHYAMVDASAGAKFSRSSQQDGYSEVFTFISEYELGSDRYDDSKGYSLTPAGTNAQNSGTWRDVCGSEFVHEITYGARFYFVYRVDFLTQDDKSKFEADLKIDVNAGVASGSLASSIEGVANKYAKHAHVHLEAYQYGGDPTQLTTALGTGGDATAAIDCDITNLKACHQVLANAITYATSPTGFIAQLKPLSAGGTIAPSPIRVFTKPWSILGIQSGNPTITNTILQNDRDSLVTKFDELMKAKTRVDRLLSGAFALPPAALQQITTWQTTLNAQLANVSSAVAVCWDQMTFGADGNPVTANVSDCTKAVQNVTADGTTIPSDADLGGAGRYVIDAKYLNLGGVSGPLGASTSDPKYAPIGGLEHDYANGAIFWNPDTDAHELHGPIYAKYQTLNLSGGILGFPITDVTPSNDVTQGSYARFQHGDLYYSPTLPVYPGAARAVLPPISDTYWSLGGGASWLGYPITDTLTLNDNVGRESYFVNGVIVWSPLGAYAIYGDFLNQWNALGSQSGALGYPTGNRNSIDANGAYSQYFANGVLWLHPTYGLHSISGSIYAEYKAISGLARLGYPTMEPATFTGRHNTSQYQVFNNGRVDYVAATGRGTALVADIYRRWLGDGAGRLPLADEIVVDGDGGRYQPLEDNYMITWSGTTGAFLVDPAMHDPVLQYRSCLGWPSGNTTYNPDGYWSVVQAIANNYVMGYHNGELQIFDFQGHRKYCP